VDISGMKQEFLSSTGNNF